MMIQAPISKASWKICLTKVIYSFTKFCRFRRSSWALTSSRLLSSRIGDQSVHGGASQRWLGSHSLHPIDESLLNRLLIQSPLSKAAGRHLSAGHRLGDFLIQVSSVNVEFPKGFLPLLLGVIHCFLEAFQSSRLFGLFDADLAQAATSILISPHRIPRTPDSYRPAPHYRLGH